MWDGMGCIICCVYNRRRRVHLDTTNTRFAFSCLSRAPACQSKTIIYTCASVPGVKSMERQVLGVLGVRLLQYPVTIEPIYLGTFLGW